MGTYLDNAATSFPKPEQVYRAIDNTLRNVGGSPGRGSHRRALEASRILFHTREKLAQLLNVEDPQQIVFTSNATEALNLALKGLLRPGDHVITTTMEHNSVLRPLKFLEGRRAVSRTVVPCSNRGVPDLDYLAEAIRPNTRAIVTTHASNVIGTIMPVQEIRRIIGDRPILLILDAAQTVGTLPIDMKELGVDLLAASGHKGLLGPQGTGFLYIRKDLVLDPLIEGGTGSHSSQEEQPSELPERYESGTQNTPGIAGLGAGIEFLLREGLQLVWSHKRHLTQLALKALQEEITRIRLYGPLDPDSQVAVISFNLEGYDPAELGFLLDEEFDIQVRSGLHCAPLAHQTIGTFPQGTVRISFGYFNSQDDIGQLIEALKRLSHRRP